MILVITFSAGLAIVFGLILAIASSKMSGGDSLVEKIKEVLPGRNCGGCGYANCEEYAKAVSKDPTLLGKCVLANDNINNKLAELTGGECKGNEKKVARVICRGGCEEKAEYKGITSCRAALLLGNFKACNTGCLGQGDCINVCEYGAISIKDGVALVDEDKCVGCGKCAEECPQGIIDMVPCKRVITVKCSSKEDKKKKAKTCKNSCTGCGICAKVCPVNAIEIKDDLAVIDYQKCRQCGLCAKKCPRGVIENKNLIKKNK